MSTDAEIDAAEERAGLRNPGYEIFIAALSVLSILNLVLLYVVQDAQLDFVLMVMNVVLTVIFLIDFLVRFRAAPSKSGYFWRGFGWADLLASLPFSQAKIFRLFRLIKVYRLLKDYGAKSIARSLVKDRAGSALLSLLLIAILMLEFGSLGLLSLEADTPDANITSASDALWYIIVTMSTVGYGDQYPITNPGRVLGTIIIIIGVGIFGTLTGYLANFFLSPAKRKVEDGLPVPDVTMRLQELKDLTVRQQAALTELEALVDGR
ncbi:MAG: ion transporter [Actinobacteria bacterium]|nr:ion transporter [Actinomycetota bacterium]